MANGLRRSRRGPASADGVKAIQDARTQLSACDDRYNATATQAGLLIMLALSRWPLAIKSFSPRAAVPDDGLEWRVLTGSNEMTATPHADASLESGRLQFVFDPRVFENDELRGALRWIADGESTDLNWSSARFVTVDPATRRLRVVTNLPPKEPCASWSCTIASGGQEPTVRFWSDCPPPNGMAVAASKLPRGGVVGLRRSTQRLELFPVISHGERPPDDAMVDWDI